MTTAGNILDFHVLRTTTPTFLVMVSVKVMLYATIFNATLLHKKSIRATWRLQAIFNATFVAATLRCTTLNRLQILTTLLQQIDCHLDFDDTWYRFFAHCVKHRLMVTSPLLKIDFKSSQCSSFNHKICFEYATRSQLSLVSF